MTTPAAEQVAALVEAHTRTRTILNDQVVALVTAQVSAFTDWSDPAATARLVASLAAQSASSQRVTASVTDAYLSRIATFTAGRRVAPAGAVDTSRLRGTDPTDVWNRPVRQYLWRISEGDDPATAQDVALKRAVGIAKTDNTLAFRAQSARFMEASGADGYRRLIHPEMAGHGSCGLCAASTGHVYARDALMPIHPGCGCSAAPVYGSSDPGYALNEADLAQLRTAAEASGGLRSVRVAVRSHGEYGPMLTEVGQKFSKPHPVQDRALRAA